MRLKFTDRSRARAYSRLLAERLDLPFHKGDKSAVTEYLFPVQINDDGTTEIVVPFEYTHISTENEKQIKALDLSHHLRAARGVRY